MYSNQSKIFGIGLSKTATTSLSNALEILGYNTKDYLGITKYIPGDLSASIDLKTIDSNDAFTDTPIPSFYKELDAKYPGSKFILTIRDMNAWLKSCKKQFTPKLAEKVNEAGNQVFLDLYGCTSFDDEKFTSGYNHYVNGVLNYFKNRQQDLLVIDLCNEEGWGTLCSFLKKPIPDVPFPMSNVTGIQRIDINDVINVAKQAGKEILRVYKKNLINETKDEDNFLIKMYRNFSTVFQQDGNESLSKAIKISNKSIVNGLKQLNSSLPLLSKEDNNISYSIRKEWHHFWLVDPLDGTEEFLNKDGKFTINIAMIQDGKPIYGVVYEPSSETLYYTKGTSGSYKVVGNHQPVKLERGNLHNNEINVITDKKHSTEETKEFLANSVKTEFKRISAVTTCTALKLCLLAEGTADIYPVFKDTMEWQTAAAHAIVKFSGKSVSIYKDKEELSYNKKSLTNAWVVVS